MVNCILCRLEIQSAERCDRYGCPVSFCSGTEWGDTITLPMSAVIPDWEDDHDDDHDNVYDDRIELDEDDDEIGAEWDEMSQYDLDGEEDEEGDEE